MTNMKKAEEVYNHLIPLKLSDGGERTVWSDATPQALRDEWQKLTGEYDNYSFIDLDEYYTVLQMLASYMSGYDDFTLDNLYECNWSDDANADRLDWLKENLSRADLYHEVDKSETLDLYDIIGDMQDMSRRDFAYAVFMQMFEGTDE